LNGIFSTTKHSSLGHYLPSSCWHTHNENIYPSDEYYHQSICNSIPLNTCVTIISITYVPLDHLHPIRLDLHLSLGACLVIRVGQERLCHACSLVSLLCPWPSQSPPLHMHIHVLHATSDHLALHLSSPSLFLGTLRRVSTLPSPFSLPKGSQSVSVLDLAHHHTPPGHPPY
jgi:hypothetical protein